MSKALAATCVAGIVSIGEFVLEDVEIFSEGVAASEGVVILDGDKAYYVAKTSPDLNSTLQQVLDALGGIKAALQDIATGPVTSPGGSAGPTFPALATSLTARVATITAAETALNTLKGNLL